MGILDIGIDLLKGIKYKLSDEPFMVGLRFEDYVSNLFSNKYFSIVEKTHSTETNQEQLKRYKEFSYQRRIPVFIVIGLGGNDNEPKKMFNIPLEEAKYPALYPSVFNRFSRNPKDSFFWKNGKLY